MHPTPSATVAFDAHWLWLSSPMLLLAIVALVVMVVEATWRPASKSGLWALTVGALGVALGLDVVLFAGAEVSTDAWSGMLRIDRYGLFFQAITLLAGLLAVLFTHDYLERHEVRVGEYYSLVLFGVAGMGMMGFANDLMMVFIALEVMSVAMYVLCAIKRADPRSVESGFKYFILGAFSSGLMLYGISFVYGITGTTALPALAHTLAAADGVSSGLLAAGGALLLVGFGFKVAAVPFHMWAPDVYQGAPMSVTALMASGVKAASFAALGRLVLAGMGDHAAAWEGAVWWMAALTMVVGNLAALVQTDLKRVLAYSSIAHAGYLLMALAAAGGGGTGAPALPSLLFYLLAYTFMNAGAFAALSAMTRGGVDGTRLEDLAGLGARHPWIAAGLSLCLLSLAGIPPTMGFVGKFYLFSAAVQGGQVGLAVIGALAAAAGVYYYLRPMVWMYMREGEPVAELSMGGRVGLAVSCAGILVLGVLPASVLDWAGEALRTVLS